MSRRLSIVLIDDHPFLAQALANALEVRGARAESVTVDDGWTAEAILERAGEADPDCVVIDLGLPVPGGGRPLIRPLIDRGLTVAVLTGETSEDLLAGCAADGAAAVVAKTEDPSVIIEVLLQVAAGEPVRPGRQAELQLHHRRLESERADLLDPFATLSPREELMLAGLMAGHGVADLAEHHVVSVETVRSQIKSVLRKLGVSSQLQAVARAHAAGWTAEQQRS